jgi:hypothetical protein
MQRLLAVAVVAVEVTHNQHKAVKQQVAVDKLFKQP